MPGDSNTSIPVPVPPAFWSTTMQVPKKFRKRPPMDEQQFIKTPCGNPDHEGASIRVSDRQVQCLTCNDVFYCALPATERKAFRSALYRPEIRRKKSSGPFGMTFTIEEDGSDPPPVMLPEVDDEPLSDDGDYAEDDD